MTPAKAIILILRSKKVRKAIAIIIAVLIFILFLFSLQEQNLISQSTTALASTAENEYEFWQKNTPHSKGLSCQGEKYCKEMGSGIVDWCAIFCGYCIKKSGYELKEFGYSSYVPTWINNLKSSGKLGYAGEYTPCSGNLIFFDYAGREHFRTTLHPNHIGIVTQVNGDEITIVAGNEYNGYTSNWAHVSEVHRYTRQLSDNSICCYGKVGSDDISAFSLNLFSSSSKLCEVTRNIICHNEVGVLYNDVKTSQLGSVIANDNGALSIGVYGWHGNNAVKLLQQTYSINSSQVISVCKSFGSSGTRVANAIKSTANWSKYIPSSNVCACIKAVLLSSAGKEAQNKMSLSDANNYIKICTKKGLKDNKCIAYCSDILNQWGTGSFDANVYGLESHGTLYGVNSKMTLKQIYNSKAGWGSNNIYINRRKWTYNYLKNQKVG